MCVCVCIGEWWLTVHCTGALPSTTDPHTFPSWPDTTHSQHQSITKSLNLLQTTQNIQNLTATLKHDDFRLYIKLNLTLLVVLRKTLYLKPLSVTCLTHSNGFLIACALEHGRMELSWKAPIRQNSCCFHKGDSLGKTTPERKTASHKSERHEVLFL